MSGTLNYGEIRATTMAKETDDRRRDIRDKAILLFTFHFLVERGMLNAAAALSSDAPFDVESFVPADNIDLRQIFSDYEEYFTIRFAKTPSYFRKGNLSPSVINQRQYQSKKRPPVPSSKIEKKPEENEDQIIPRSLPYLSEGEKVFVEELLRDLVVQPLGIRWDDVEGPGRDAVRSALEEAPALRSFFGDAVGGWRGMLLYGPPGTGKTLLARAAASEGGRAFFNVSSASIVSKWRGESERLVRTLFILAAHHAPSIIFFDELEGLAGSREGPGESEASRRLKSQLLAHMDGLLTHSTGDIFLLAATNLPWEIDTAVVRRLEKRIYIGLPSASERGRIIGKGFGRAAEHVKNTPGSTNALILNLDLHRIAEKTEGYSGSDIDALVKETLVRKLREVEHGTRRLLIQTRDVEASLQNIQPTVRSALVEKFKAWTMERNSQPYLVKDISRAEHDQEKEC